MAFTLLALSAQLFCGAAARHRYAELCIMQTSSATWLRSTLLHKVPAHVLGTSGKTAYWEAPSNNPSLMTVSRIRFALT